MTVFCLLSLTIGAYIIWVILDKNDRASAAAVFPMTVVGVVHLLGGSIAIYHAVKTGSIVRNVLVYGYFSLFLLLVLWVVIGNGNNPLG